ncbi:DUF342 domain-containing protein [Aliidiomarina minuta]|uniref:DUF342 domain-containing protein n=1 Tax=Aliidiomarina minuta TaxID=880057 RepID=A0A432W8R8_9GAMM|nr:FapA family protein [Aliidiomarina minuta]RUO26472.1 DUF342 domain-containing protein [Aliidiomarina minuta]
MLDENALSRALTQFKTENQRVARIGACVPPRLELVISDDDMQVTAKVTAPQGGPPLTVNTFLQELREQGVTLGIRRAAIDKLIQHTLSAEPGSSTEALIARGKFPVDGSDTQFKQLVQDARQRVLQPKELDGDKVDMRDLGEILSVDKGTPLLQRIPATPGTAGFTVRGATLDAAAGADRELQAGIGTEISADDPNILLASRQGLPCLVDNAANVDDVLSMRKVDATTGHVEYEGSVLIQGNIGPGMRVIAGGDVTVSGYVDSAHIESGGNVTITKGVIGQQNELDSDDVEDQVPEHSTQISAKGSIWVSYSQYATLTSEHGVIVDKQLTHCHVITKGTLCLGGEGKEARGKLIGGVVDTCNHIYAGQIGAPAGTRTSINLSMPPVPEAYLQEQEKLTAELRDELGLVKKLTRVRQKASLEESSPKLKEFLSTLDQKLENHRRNVTVLRIRAAELLKKDPAKAPIISYANRVLYAGTLFRSDVETKAIHENRGPSTLILRNGNFNYQYVG